jgi:hypothetical protein
MIRIMVWMKVSVHCLSIDKVITANEGKECKPGIDPKTAAILRCIA